MSGNQDFFSFYLILTEVITKTDIEFIKETVKIKRFFNEFKREMREHSVIEENLDKIQKCCEKFLPQLFTYLQYEGMPPDNNLAERKLRIFARQRKISGGFKSLGLMKHYVGYLSFFMICRANGCDFDQL